MENINKHGKIFLNNMEFYNKIGVPDAERKIMQLFIISVGFSFDFEEAARKDELNKTINYAGVYKLCVRMMEKEFKLIETLAYNIAHEVKKQYPETFNIEVSVKKPQVQMKAKLENAQVIYYL